jgi:transposase
MTRARCRPAAPPNGAAGDAAQDRRRGRPGDRPPAPGPPRPATRRQAAHPDPDWDELVALRNQRRSLIAQRRRLLNEAESVLVGLPLVVRAVLPATSQVRPRLRALAHGAADQLELTGADRVHLAWLTASTADIGRLDQRIRQLDQRIPAVLARQCCTLTEEVGIAAVGAMELLVEVGDPTRFATEARFARWCGAAPVAVSFGEGDGAPERHRLDLGGNRRVNSVLHTMHITQARCYQPAKDDLRGKRVEHKTAREARRAPKRLLANVVIRRMWADHQRRRSPTLNLADQTTPKAARQRSLESTFATVRLRQRVTKGPGSRAAGVAVAFKLIESAQARSRAVNAPHLVALIRAGARFENGKLVERPDESGGEAQVA